MKAAGDPKTFITELAANLACRKRLGLGLISRPELLPELLAELGLVRAGVKGPVQGGAQVQAPAMEEGGGLDGVRRTLGDCTRCALHQGRRKLVFGQGPENAAVMFIGEAPGAQEDSRGIPFVGPAGRLLELMLQAVGLMRGQVYITNIVKCRPPNNRDPLPEEAEACRPFLEAQIAAIGPRIICTLGRPAAQKLLKTEAPISALRGSWQSYGKIPVLPTFHPAYLLRQPARKAQAYQDLKTLAAALRQGV